MIAALPALRGRQRQATVSLPFPRLKSLIPFQLSAFFSSKEGESAFGHILRDPTQIPGLSRPERHGMIIMALSFKYTPRRRLPQSRGP